MLCHYYGKICLICIVMRVRGACHFLKDFLLLKMRCESRVLHEAQNTTFMMYFFQRIHIGLHANTQKTSALVSKPMDRQYMMWESKREGYELRVKDKMLTQCRPSGLLDSCTMQVKKVNPFGKQEYTKHESPGYSSNTMSKTQTRSLKLSLCSAWGNGQ